MVVCLNLSNSLLATSDWPCDSTIPSVYLYSGLCCLVNVHKLLSRHILVKCVLWYCTLCFWQSQVLICFSTAVVLYQVYWTQSWVRCISLLLFLLNCKSQVMGSWSLSIHILPEISRHSFGQSDVFNVSSVVELQPYLLKVCCVCIVITTTSGIILFPVALFPLDLLNDCTILSRWRE